MERELAPVCAHVFESLGRIMTTFEYISDVKLTSTVLTLPMHRHTLGLGSRRTSDCVNWIVLYICSS